MFEQTINGVDFQVDADGAVYQSQRVSDVARDNVRRLAADHFLSSGSKITQAQRRHWANVARRSEVRA